MTDPAYLVDLIWLCTSMILVIRRPVPYSASPWQDARTIFDHVWQGHARDYSPCSLITVNKPGLFWSVGEPGQGMVLHEDLIWMYIFCISTTERCESKLTKNITSKSASRVIPWHVAPFDIPLSYHMQNAFGKKQIWQLWSFCILSMF